MTGAEKLELAESRVDRTGGQAFRPRSIALLWVLFYAATVLLYTPFLAPPYFSDDFLSFFSPPPQHLYEFFGIASHPHSYRPAESIILTLIQQRFGFSTLPVHLVSFAAQATMCAIVWLAAIRLRAGTAAAAASAVIMLISQTGTPALLGNDCMSQAMSASLAALGVFLAALDYRRREQEGRSSAGLVVSSVLAYCGAILFKETALGSIVMIALLAFLPDYRKGGWKRGLPGMARRILPYAVLTAVYLALRARSGTSFGAEGGFYHLQIGFNIFRNLAEFIIYTLSPVSSVTVALAAQTGQEGTLAACAGIIVFVIAVMVAGLRGSPKHPVALVAFGAVASIVPAVLLPHVSELYAYAAEPYVALLFGLALAGLWRRRGIGKAVAVCAAALTIGGQVYADRQKAALMNANGHAAERLLPAIAEHVRKLPAKGELLLTEAPYEGPRYSIYVMHGLDVLNFATYRLGAIFGRPDVTIRIVPAAEAVLYGRASGRDILEWKDGELVEWKP